MLIIRSSTSSGVTKHAGVSAPPMPPLPTFKIKATRRSPLHKDHTWKLSIASGYKMRQAATAAGSEQIQGAFYRDGVWGEAPGTGMLCAEFRHEV